MPSAASGWAIKHWREGDKIVEKGVGKEKMDFFLKKIRRKMSVFLIYFSLLSKSGKS